MVWISTDGRHRVTPEIGGRVVEWDALAPLTMGAFDELDDYNGPLHRGKMYDTIETKLSDTVKAAADDSMQLCVNRASQWIAPYFARAESQANFCQAWYKRIGVGLLLLSFAAVALVAGQELFLPHHPAIVWVEVAMLIAALVGLLIGWKCRFHDRWITARYLGESLRSALFLAVAGIGDDHLHRQPRLMNDEPTDAWVRRAFAEVWAKRPIWQPTEADVGPLQRLLAAGWIGDQLIYYDKAARRHARVHKRLTLLAYAFFVISVAAAVLHSLNVAHGKTESFALWGFLSIVIPAAAGALSGLAAQREFHQHAQRYGRMTRRMTDAKLQMEMATDLVAVQRLALKTERAIREESGEWFGVVRLHDLELPS